MILITYKLGTNLYIKIIRYFYLYVCKTQREGWGNQKQCVKLMVLRVVMYVSVLRGSVPPPPRMHTQR